MGWNGETFHTFLKGFFPSIPRKGESVFPALFSTNDKELYGISNFEKKGIVSYTSVKKFELEIR